ncbi:uncharacterized protein LOC142977010 [Anticarsia gemmatalis]|uniref:uncharacterized protein LOC142977010 n=1 Tax=Anticarsia gemmatalis TaxID=129554 RepID=UPI003F777D15
MFALIICALALSATIDVAQCKCLSDYIQLVDKSGWLWEQRELATFEEAAQHCKQLNAELASPYNAAILDGMKRLMDADLEYHVSLKVTLRPLQLPNSVSQDAAVAPEMTKLLQNKLCVSMSEDEVNMVPCSKKLRYMCYVPEHNEINVCGENGYQFKNSTGSCYKVHTEHRSWQDANAVCMMEGGYLAVLNDAEESRVVQELFPQDHAFPFFPDCTKEIDPMYIGLQKLYQNEWLGVHGEKCEWDWNKGEPNKLNIEHCGTMIRNGKLNNIEYHLKTIFICERDARELRHIYQTESLLDQVVDSTTSKDAASPVLDAANV